MIETAKSAPPNSVRIVHTSSSGHILSDGLHFDTFYDGKEGKNKARHKMGKINLYGQSKFVRLLIYVKSWKTCSLVHRDLSFLYYYAI